MIRIDFEVIAVFILVSSVTGITTEISESYSFDRDHLTLNDKFMTSHLTDGLLDQQTELKREVPFDGKIRTQESDEIATSEVVKSTSGRIVEPSDDERSLRYIFLRNRRDTQLKTSQQNEILKKSNGPQDVFELFKLGERTVKIEAQKDVIVLLGNTGSGKSTFSQFISGHDSDLTAYEKVEGSGDFIIKDTAGKIGTASTITSKTTFPELVVDSKTNAKFYDCPGFSDTRSAAHDIAATYFTKKIISNANRVKLLFIVNHSSVRHGVDRRDFINLVKHATNLIKNIDKFNDSIALIVTKVENQFVRRQLVPDENVIKSIADFLVGARDDVSSKMVTDGDSFRANAIKFINVLLQQKGDQYSKIGIFRRPDEPGTLDKITLLQDGKKLIEEILYNNTQFTRHDIGDFGYAISSDSKLHIYDLTIRLTDDIAYNVKKMAHDIKAHFVTQEKQSNNFSDLSSKFQVGYDLFSAIKEATKLQVFLSNITNITNKLQISIPHETFENIGKSEDYLTFLKDFSDQKVDGFSKWFQECNKLVKYLDESQVWYKFLNRLHPHLTTYHVQKDVNRFKSLISEYKRQIQADIQNEKIIQLLKQFLDEAVPLESPTEHDQIRHVLLSKEKAKKLELVLDDALKYDIEISCETTQDGKLAISGSFVRLSDVYKSECHEKHLKFIEIKALEKVFIDTDLDLTGRKLQMSIVAPIWDVIGRHNIILDGEGGGAHTPWKAPKRWRFDYDNHGNPGEPGFPGGPAGSFFGIGDNFLNSDNLHISAKGGKGGPGQIGGDGVNGADGTQAPNPRDWKFYMHKNTVWANRESYCTSPKIIDSVFIWWERRVECDLWGSDCTDGSDGGDGGQGGKGGKAGRIKIVATNDKPSISVDNSDGETGDDGAGGQPGLPGLTGKKRRVWADYIKGDIFGIVYKHTVRESVYFGRTCSTGKTGIAGQYDEGIQEAAMPTILNGTDDILSEYKSFAEDNMEGVFEKLPVKNFLDRLESNSTDTYVSLL